MTYSSLGLSFPAGKLRVDFTFWGPFSRIKSPLVRSVLDYSLSLSLILSNSCFQYSLEMLAQYKIACHYRDSEPLY